MSDTAPSPGDWAELERLLGEVQVRLDRAVTLSAALGAAGEAERRRVGRLWEETLGRLMAQIRQESRKSRQNLLGWISFRDVLRG